MKKLACIAALLLTAAVMFGCGQNNSKTVVLKGDDSEAASATYAPVTEDEIKNLPRMVDEEVSKYVELGEYKGLEVSIATEEPTASEIQERIDNNLKSLAEMVEVTDRPVREGDTVNIDYEGKKDGVAFDRGTAQGYDLKIGSHNFINGFEDGLIGATVGETRDLDLTFPEQYQNAELAGQAVVFTVTVNSIRAEEIPELTDSLANTLNPACKTVAEYKEAIRQSLIETKKETAIQTARNTLMEKVVDQSTVKEVPEWLMRIRMQSLRTNMENYAAANGVDYEQFIEMAMECSVEEFEQQAKEYAQEDAKMSMVAYAIGEKEGILMSDEQLEQEMAAYLSSMGITDDPKEFLATADGRSYSDYLQFQKVTDWLYDNAKVTE